MAAGRIYDPQLQHVIKLLSGTATSVRGEQTATRVGRGTVSHEMVLDFLPWVGGLVDWLGQSLELPQDVLEGGGPGKNLIYKGGTNQCWGGMGAGPSLVDKCLTLEANR